MAYRLDINGRAKSYKRTPQGGIHAPAYLTRTGVFTYQVSDGKGGTRPFRELRLPEEVFSPASLETLASAPVTRGHPTGGVTAKTWKAVSIGHVGEDVKVDQQYVAANVRIQDEDAVADIEGGKLVEFSCGYECDVELSQGTYDGIPYEGIQRNIRYNHVGMGPSNWGRAGNEVRLRVDSAEGDAIGEYCDSYSSGMTEAELKALNEKLAAETARADAAEAKVAELNKARTDAADELNKARTDAVALTSERDVALGERDVAVKRADAAEKAVPDRVAARVTLEREALVTLGSDFRADGLSDHDLRVAAVKKVDNTFDATGQSEDYVRGVFSSIIRAEKSADKSLEALRRDASAAPGAGGQEKNEIQRNAEASRNVVRPWDKA